eukprot:NODE_485_length_7794_cov_0.605848.p4 type:complete len:209 gc:universal NODE_485_length_7794_cov_0.605848:6405-7031(+)
MKTRLGDCFNKMLHCLKKKRGLACRNKVLYSKMNSMSILYLDRNTLKRKRPPDFVESDQKRFCDIKIVSNCKIITMTLKRALRHENSKKVMDKLELIVPFISSASKIIFYFLNWYTTEYKQLFPLTYKFAQNHLELIFKVILGQRSRIKDKSMSDYAYLFQSLEQFLTLFPNFQLKCPLECHQSMMNLVCITLSTNINLCHLQYFDTE